ncbi:MAG TPA: cell wall-binding repeat-containing protein [Patescibacteria group bacterium]|nr:cell wall-binding repeat-containing protein [Patescibacteria group bacterium]
MNKIKNRGLRPLLSTLLIVSLLLCTSVPALAEQAPAADRLVQCDGTGNVINHTAITGVNLPVVFDNNPDFYPISVDTAIYDGATQVKELTGLAPDENGDLKIGLGTVTNYESDTVYEIEYRAHYGIIGEGTEIIEEWQSTGLYFKVEATSGVTNAAFTAATADGVADTTTSTKIDLAFDTTIAGLTADDITITNETGAVIKGALTGSGTSWSIVLTSVTTQGDVSVAVAAPAGYSISGSPKTVAVYKAVVPTPVTLQTAVANGASGTTTSTKIDLVFGTAIAGLTAADITITGDTGSATKGALTGSGTNWSIAVSVVSEGTVSVAVGSPAGYAVSGSPKTVSVYSYTAPSTPTIIDVTVAPATATVQKGTTHTFIAMVNGTNGPTQTVTWSVYGNTSLSTVIDASGELTVAADETATELTVRATSTYDNTKFGTATVTVTTAPVTTYTVTFNSNGLVYTTKIVNAEESIGSAAWPTDPTRSSYTFGGWFTGENGAGAQFISATPVNATTTVYAKWTYSGGGGGGTPSTPTTPTHNADVKAGNGSETTFPVTVNKDNGSAAIDTGSHQFTLGGTVITIPSIPDVDTYSVGIPVPDLSTSDAQGMLTIHTGNGSVTVPSNMLTGVSDIGGSKAEITIGQGDKSALLENVKAAIGDKPLIQLTLSIDGKQTDWSNRNAPLTVSIPYTPTAAELANSGSIVVWYIDGSGKAVSVPNGRYDLVTGTVTFFSTHFSNYAVAYVQKTFSDLGGVEWARKAIEVMASKGITSGTGDGTTFSPSVNMTRADYMVLLINTLGLTADFTDSFDDVKPGAYYYNAVGIAKELGIAAGSGNNFFNPTESISRQDMMVLAARALEKYQGLKAADNNTSLNTFSDKGDIAEYAVNSLATLVNAGLIEGSGNKLNPRSYTTRAEVVVFLYNIYNKYPEAPVIAASTLSRLAGQTKNDTALSVAKAAYPDKVTNAVLATADYYPDALAGSVLAYQLNAPILLVDSSEADQEKVVDYLKANLEQEGRVYILGGTAVVSSGMDAKLQNSGFNHITRIAGETRYDTAVKIADQLNVKTGTPVVLVSGENYPDALAVSSIAAQNQFPILLVQKDGIGEAVSEELAALKPSKIYIIGLEGAISPAVESQAAKITGLAAENIVRIGGADRYATSLAIAEYFNLGSQTMCIATGNKFPDALAGSVYAAKTKAPIILTDSSLSEQTMDYVESRKPAETTIFGGEAVVGKDIEQQIKQLLKQ